MARHIALIDGKPGAYGVVFPDAPGCAAMGKTLDEALAHAAAALGEWIADEIAAGRGAPEPRSADEARLDREVGEALAEGALLTVVSGRYRLWQADQDQCLARRRPSGGDRPGGCGPEVDPVGFSQHRGAREDRDRVRCAKAAKGLARCFKALQLFMRGWARRLAKVRLGFVRTLS